ncbi:hypothetical protein GCM10023090_25170 [Acidovorax lacteus]|uniref:Uncharacterized protein n=1 Tax=Acidovorax lacteus TaxID=1924988 RepID=A0ABP8LEW7_9BURK
MENEKVSGAFVQITRAVCAKGPDGSATTVAVARPGVPADAARLPMHTA